MCAPGTICLVTNGGIYTLCRQLCDPIAQDCGDDSGCYFVFTNFICILTGQNLQEGETCANLNSCAPGYLCTPAETLPACEGNKCCTAYCDLDNGDADCTTEGTACVPWYENPQDAMPGNEDVGACQLPP